MADYRYDGSLPAGLRRSNDRGFINKNGHSWLRKNWSKILAISRRERFARSHFAK